MTPRRARCERIDPCDIELSAEPIDRNEPTEKAENAEPMEPMDRNDPTEPMDSIEPLDPIERNESSDHSDHRALDAIAAVSRDRGQSLCNRVRHVLLTGHAIGEAGGMTMRTRIGVAFFAAALVFGSSLATAGTAGAADSHSVTVSPSRGLSDGQTVTVTGSGFVETPALYDWAVVECSAAILTDGITLDNALKDCDAGGSPDTGGTFAHADAGGNLSPTPFVVRTSFSTTTPTPVPVTCGQAPNDCAILVAQLTTPGGTFVGAAAPISFGTPVRTVAECYRELTHDHQHSLRYRLVHLLTCVFTALHHERH
jgi:hypothetical protein